MEYTDFDSLIANLKEISVQRNYWLVRTIGGAYYGDFLRNNYIAIGYNEISIQELRVLPASEKEAKDILSDMISVKRPDIDKPGYVASQLLRFTRLFHPGDVVIIPSTDSTHVAIGIIQDDIYEDQSPLIDGEHHCSFKKRRQVRWLLWCRKGKLPPTLLLMFSSHHAISDVSHYGSYIDSVTNDFYTKDNLTHLVLRISTKKEVSLDDFCNLRAVNLLIQKFAEFYGINSVSDECNIIMKVQMESPGWLRLSCKVAKWLLIFGLFTVALAGGGLYYQSKSGDKINLGTNGILESINEFLDRKADRKLVEAAAKAMDSLKITSPKDLEPIIKILDRRNEGRKIDQAGK